MSAAPDALAERVVAALTPEEQAGAVAYAAHDPLRAGVRLDLAGAKIETAAPAWLVFIDADPTANWGHPARYLILDCDGGEVRSVETRLPPPAALDWRLIYQAPSVPDAAVAFPQ
ncbi:MAG TPA: hypothetical protein VGH15_14465 [Caulobacteraceae bacterium]|jgi:hypothetical protein